MNEEIISTAIYTAIASVFIIAFFDNISKTAILENAYLSHAKALQQVRQAIQSCSSFEDCCNYAYLQADAQIRIIRGNDSCQSGTSSYYSRKEEKMIVSLPSVKNNEVVWVSSYA